MTVGHLFEQYFNRHVRSRLRNWRNAHYFWRVHGGRWAGVPAASVSRLDVQAWCDELAARSPSASTRAVDQLSAVFGWAIRRGLFGGPNPCAGVEKHKIAARERFLLPGELRRFCAVLDGEEPTLRDFVWLSLLTGARRSNVLSMRWEEIDVDLAVWRIPAEKFKNGSSHLVPLCPDALAVLARRKETVGPSPYVFPGRRPGQHLKEPKRAWQRLLRRAEIGDLRIHDLRRTLGSYMAIQGESLTVIGQALGHKDPRSTMVYARLHLGAVRHAMERAVGSMRG